MGGTHSGSAPGEIDGHELEVLGDKIGRTEVRIADKDAASNGNKDTNKEESKGGMRYYWVRSPIPLCHDVP